MSQFSAIPDVAKDNEQPRFDERYIYAGTYAYTRLSKLLSEAERERLIGTSSVHELEEVLKTTYFGSYFVGAATIDAALDAAMLDAKKILNRISPNPHLLSVLWLRYDFYNLKVIMKQHRLGSEEASEERFIPFGQHNFALIEKAVKSGNAATLENHLAAALTAAPADTTPLDSFLEIRYLEAALEEAKLVDKPFAVRYTRLLINLFAILSALRAHARGETPVHIKVSDLSPKDIASVDTLLTRLTRFGFSKHWQQAVENYRATNDFSLLDRAADDYLMKWLKRQSIMLDSPAPLFAFWHVFRENVQLIRAVHTARKVHMNEKDLRDIIRTSYNAYVY